MPLFSFIFISLFLSLGRPLDDSSFFFLFFFFLLFSFSIFDRCFNLFGVFVSDILTSGREREREREVFIGNDQHVILIEFTSALVI